MTDIVYGHRKDEPPRDPRRDQEQGDGARLSKLDGLSCHKVVQVVPQQLLFGHCLCVFAQHTVETAISEVHKLLGAGGVPTSLT